MRFSRQVQAIDTHTEGMPTRIVTGGVGVLPGDSMAARREHFLEHMNDFRTFLMCEPRGHAAMAGALLQPPTSPEADIGVIYMDAEGSVPVCGHGAMGTAMALVETGMVKADEPITTVRLDTPAGLVTADVEVHDGHTTRVSVTGVPSYVLGQNLQVDVPNFGTLTYDLVYGGNHCAILDLAQLNLPFDLEARTNILTAGLAIITAITKTRTFTHPSGTPATLRHAQLLAPNASPTHSRHAMIISPGWFDRSPCGTGTAGRMAQLHANGELPLNTDFTNESFIGTHFTGRLLDTTTINNTPAVIPRITGRAWITGTAQYSLDPTDALANGFLL